MQQNTNLHVHSSFSDGLLSPIELLALGNSSGLKLLSITDHNSLDAYEEILFAPKGNVGITIGTEISCKHFNRTRGKETVLHVCAYFPGKQDETLCDTFEIISPMQRVCRNAAAGINERRKIQVKKLRKAGFDISISEVLQQAALRSAREASVTMLDIIDIAKVLSRKTSLGFEEARQMLKQSPEFYVSAKEGWQCYWIETLAKKISMLGGIACLAHPTRRIPLEALDETLSEFSGFGINAVEAFNKTTKEEENKIIELAAKHCLLVTTGNDFHDCGKPLNPTACEEAISAQLARKKTGALPHKGISR